MKKENRGWRPGLCGLAVLLLVSSGSAGCAGGQKGGLPWKNRGQEDQEGKEAVPEEFGKDAEKRHGLIFRMRCQNRCPEGMTEESRDVHLR